MKIDQPGSLLSFGPLHNGAGAFASWIGNMARTLAQQGVPGIRTILSSAAATMIASQPATAMDVTSVVEQAAAAAISEVAGPRAAADALQSADAPLAIVMANRPAADITPQHIAATTTALILTTAAPVIHSQQVMFEYIDYTKADYKFDFALTPEQAAKARRDGALSIAKTDIGNPYSLSSGGFSFGGFGNQPMTMADLKADSIRFDLALTPEQAKRDGVITAETSNNRPSFDITSGGFGGFGALSLTPTGAQAPKLG